ncbi:MAG TPA: glycoside hydrolase family 3 C-terminal domain-containing protein [Verrucomicrobiae bacterium]|nr:glycoside hydrolase family 3 C-terminal domain-containing protein [Verrucomicrobiae bacterium]
MKSNQLQKFVGVALFAILLCRLVRADEIYTADNYQIILSGDFNHSKLQAADISGAPVGGENAFRREIFGGAFKLSVPDLNSGKYKIILGFSENYAGSAGERIFDITSGNQIIAHGFDIFAAAGGKSKVVYLTNEIVFDRTETNQPLTLNFFAEKNNAKFNTFELCDAENHLLVFARATDFVPGVADDPAALKIPIVTAPEIWTDSSQPLDARIKDLIRRLSLAEKVSQLSCEAPAIPRLNIPAYNYRNEALHGYQPQTGHATVFPQSIGMAATWDTALIHDEADVIATEARAIHNDYIAKHNGESSIHFGINLYAPNINIFRDPRWGRGQETYGEDPFLTSQFGVAFITGLQGDDPNYFKTIATAKHYAIHSGPEFERHRFNVNPPERDLYETYLPAFEAAVREGHVDSIMGAYSAFQGTPDCANPFLLTDVLRKQWGFDGFVVSDGGAIADINLHHKFVATPEEAAAAAVKAGCDLCSGGGREYYALTHAVKLGLISEAEIDAALYRGLKARFQLGNFDPPEKNPYSKITIAENDTPAHAALALKVARESIVLLKNDGTLPLKREQLKRILVVGANANSVSMLSGNYSVAPSQPVSILDGIKSVAGSNIEVTYELGCPLVTGDLRKSKDLSKQNLSNALAAATNSDLIIYVGGLSAQLEGEEMGIEFDGFYHGDRTKIELPEIQTKFLQALQTTGKPVVFVNCSGSAIAMPWEIKNLSAIVQAWYPGEQGGRAVAEILFGDVNPAGRLPVTFYNATADLPDFENYSMSNRTYRYFNGQPEFAFGYGLSYTKFDYRDAKLNGSNFTTNDTIQISFTIQNTGARDGDEVPQIYFRHVNSSVPQPKLALCGFERVNVPSNQTTNVTVQISPQRLRYWDTTKKQYVVEAGDYELLVGASSDDIRLKAPFKIAP